MSTKITNNLKVLGEDTTNKYTDVQYASNEERANGVQTGTPISSKLINSALRQSTLFVTAFIEALKTVIPNTNDLTEAITIGNDTLFDDLVDTLIEGLTKIKVEQALLADNVKSGAIVAETTTARESKQGYGISLALNTKLTFKGTWAGTYKNNDLIYYGESGSLKGYYVVKGLSIETTSSAAQTLTIEASDTPTTHVSNLARLTTETNIGVDTNLSKSDVITSSSTTNQLLTSKGAYDFAITYNVITTPPSAANVVGFKLVLLDSATYSIASTTQYNGYIYMWY
jgi:hypothetical protein